MGSDQPAKYQLAEESVPVSPPASTDELIVQAIINRPELASLRSTRDSAYRFFEAEKDLKRPTVSIEAVAGYIPYNQYPADSADPC